MDNQSCKSNEIVTLVLQDHRITAKRNKLASNSLYFKSLFSENFKDHRQTEFAINYEISLGTLQDFVNWANEEGEDSNCIDSVKYNFIAKKSLQRFLTGNRPELLELLELSIVFSAEKLTEDITEMIICMRFPPDAMLEIWLLAEELCLKALKDAAFAICVDRFNEITISSLADLSLDHFTKLVSNINVEGRAERFLAIRKAWKRRNDLPSTSLDSKWRFIKGKPDDIIAAVKEAKPQYSQCVVGHKLNKAQVIYAWNGETLQELVEVDREITARKVVARGFYIYAIGRKKRDVKHFNTTIWRYCHFTKKWYTETILPRRRRNMVAAFLANELYLFGGTDPTGQKVSAVDVYNVHTGVWSKAAEIPVSLAEIRSSCVTEGKFLYHEPDKEVHVYEPLGNKWAGYRLWGPPIEPRIECTHIQLPIGTHRKPDVDVSVIYVRNWRPQLKRSTLGIFTLESEQYVQMDIIHNWDTAPIDQQVLNGPYLVSFGYRDGTAIIEIGIVTQIPRREYDAIYRCIELYEQKLCDVPANCFQLNMGCFNLVDPGTLYDTFEDLIRIGGEFAPVRHKRRMRDPELFRRLKGRRGDVDMCVAM